MWSTKHLWGITAKELVLIEQNQMTLNILQGVVMMELNSVLENPIDSKTNSLTENVTTDLLTQTMEMEWPWYNVSNV